jgi:hypothetical protein
MRISMSVLASFNRIHRCACHMSDKTCQQFWLLRQAARVRRLACVTLCMGGL